MSTKYSQAGYNFSSSCKEIAGIGHKLTSISNLAATKELQEELEIVSKALAVLDDTIMSVLKKETAAMLNDLTAKIKNDYTAILNGTKTHINSPEEDKKAASKAVSDWIKPIGEIFTSKNNAKLGAISSQISHLSKIEVKNLEILGINSIFERMKANVQSYLTLFSDNATEEVEKKSIKLQTAKKNFLVSLQGLKTVIEYLQQKGAQEESFVKGANEIWANARQSQNASKLARQKAKGKKQ